MHSAQQQFRDRLFFKAGLYEQIPVTFDMGGVWATGERTDGHCVPCRRESTMVITRRQDSHASYNSGVNIVELECSRDCNHVIVYAILSGSGWMMKIGQWPSIADIGLGELRRFDGVLDDTDRSEFARAIGLNAHGVGVGAFVYLRRILERLVREAEQQLQPPVDASARMVDRIKALKDVVPRFLTDNPLLYGVLSQGIHELSEQDCLAAFPVVRAAIEEVMEEKRTQKSRAAAREKTRRELGALTQKRSPNTDMPSN